MKALLVVPKALLWAVTIGKVNLFKKKLLLGMPEQLFMVNLAPTPFSGTEKSFVKEFDKIFNSKAKVGFSLYDFMPELVPEDCRRRFAGVENHLGDEDYDNVRVAELTPEDFIEVCTTESCCSKLGTFSLFVDQDTLSNLEKSKRFLIIDSSEATDRLYEHWQSAKKEMEARAELTKLLKSGKIPSECPSCGADTLTRYSLERDYCQRCGHSHSSKSEELSLDDVG